MVGENKAHGKLRYISNSSWMLAEQALRIASGFLVGIYIARYLGPVQYGLISYLMAMVSVLVIVSRLGMDAILVRELINQPDKRPELTSTALVLMLSVALACYALLVLIYLISDESVEIKFFAVILLSTPLFSSFLALDYCFQSEVKAKVPAFLKSVTLIIMSVFKLSLVWLEEDLIYFIVAMVLDHAVLAMFLVVAAYFKNFSLSVTKFSKELAKVLLKASLPMMLSSAALIIYMRVDQIMISHMLGLESLGVYSAAIKIYESWVTFPYVVTVSLLPLIIKIKKDSQGNYSRRLTQLCSALVWLSALIAAFVTLFGEKIIGLSFGDAYIEAVPSLIIVMWASVFASMGSLSARYLNAEHLENKILLRSIAGLLLNVFLNLILIPVWGVEGAALSNLICSFIVNYLMDWSDRQLRPLAIIKTKALNPLSIFKT